MNLPNLNAYQLQFLQMLIKRSVRFLIIGGQTRFFYHGTPTRDLDLWVDISPSNKLALQTFLVMWAAKYPLHSNADFTIPIPLRPNVQIKFPDADVWFMGIDDKPTPITPDDGIDILTSVNEADFGEYFGRAKTVRVNGMNLPFLSVNDLDAISPKA
jgi:hypothetical protein